MPRFSKAQVPSLIGCSLMQPFASWTSIDFGIAVCAACLLLAYAGACELVQADARVLTPSCATFSHFVCPRHARCLVQAVHLQAKAKDGRSAAVTQGVTKAAGSRGVPPATKMPVGMAREAAPRNVAAIKQIALANIFELTGSAADVAEIRLQATVRTSWGCVCTDLSAAARRLV